MRKFRNKQQSQEQRIFRAAEVWGSVHCSGLLTLRGWPTTTGAVMVPSDSAFLIPCWAISCVFSNVAKINTILSSPTVKPQPPFNLTAVFAEGYNISWETIYQNSFYFLNEELEYQLRYKRRTDTWEVSEMSVYHQVRCVSKEEASRRRTGALVWKNGSKGFEKFLFACLDQKHTKLTKKNK